jgi:phosphoglycolate phosphatase-like HAD superfamily hydrolase
MLEILSSVLAAAPLAAVFDFDGTISTLRCGWERVMRPLMLECISPGAAPTPALEAEVDRYIDESTGIQTIYQMQWLARRVVEAGGPARDPWDYKAEYNRRLMERVAHKKCAVETGAEPPARYLVAGALEFLGALKARGVRLYLASGTDDADVKAEAALLGAAEYFTAIAGAPAGVAACSKEAVLQNLIETGGVAGERLLVVGDGKVEIALGKARGAKTLGAATNEITGRGVNETKRRRLIAAGADAITGDFTDLAALTDWIFG